MTADTVGGVWTYAVDLCRALEGRNVEVLLATMGAEVKPHQRNELAGLSHVRLAESRFALEWMEAPWADVQRAGRWLLELEESFRPHAVHLNGYVHGSLPFGAPVLCAGHSCVRSWWKAVRGEPVPSSWDTYTDKVQLGLRSARLVVAPTRWMLDQLRAEYGALRATRVIPNARPWTQGGGPKARKEPYILSVGRLWDDAKNARALARVAADLPWPVRLAGDPRSPDGAEVTLANVEHLGFLPPDAMAGQYAGAGIYALPALYEPFGLSVLEAAQHACALVLGDIPSLREVWGDAAMYVPPRDSAGLEAALRMLVCDAPLRQRYGRAAEDRARSFSLEALARAYLDAYSDLITPFRSWPVPAGTAHRDKEAEPVSSLS